MPQLESKLPLVSLACDIAFDANNIFVLNFLPVVAFRVDICSLLLAGSTHDWFSLTSALLPFTFKVVSSLSAYGTADLSKSCLATLTVSFTALFLTVKLPFSTTLLLSSLFAFTLPLRVLSAAIWLPSVTFLVAASRPLPFIAFCLISCAIALGSFLLASSADLVLNSVTLALSFASIFAAASLPFTTVWAPLLSPFTVSALTLLPAMLLAKLIPINTLAKPTDNLRKL